MISVKEFNDLIQIIRTLDTVMAFEDVTLMGDHFHQIKSLELVFYYLYELYGDDNTPTLLINDINRSNIKIKSPKFLYKPSANTRYHHEVLELSKTPCVVSQFCFTRVVGNKIC